VARDGHTHASVVTSSGLRPANSCRYVAPFTSDGLMEVKKVLCCHYYDCHFFQKLCYPSDFLLPNAAQFNSLNSVEHLPL